MKLTTKPNRRGFLGMLAAAPVAGKKAIETMAEDLTDTAVGFEPVGFPPSEAVDEAVDENVRSKIDRKGVFEYFLNNGVPDWKKSELKQQVNFIRSIEPSITVLRSVSLTGKHQMQRNQNYQRALKRLEEQFSGKDVEDEARKFFNKFGVWL